MVAAKLGLEALLTFNPMKKETIGEAGVAMSTPSHEQVERWLDSGQALLLHPWLDELLRSSALDLQLELFRAMRHLGAERAGDARLLQLARRQKDHAGLQTALLRVILGNRGAYAYWRATQSMSRPSEEPDLAERLSLDALWLAKLRDETQALKAGREALRLRPADPWLWVEHSYALVQLDRAEAAREAVQQALVLQPDFRTGIQQLAELELRGERPEAARALLEPLLAATGNGHVAWQLHGLAVDEDRCADALSLLEATQKGWPLADTRLQGVLAARRADALHRLGRRQAAREEALTVPGTGFYTRFAEQLASDVAAERSLLPLPRIRQHWMTCAPATLAALARYWGHEAEHLEVAQAICYDGTSQASERLWAQQQGFQVRECKLDWTTSLSLIDAGIPFALATRHVGGGHLQAVVGYDSLRRTLLVRDPSLALHAEYEAQLLFDAQQSGGPRAMVMLPSNEAHRLDGIFLPEAAAWDLEFQLLDALQRHDRCSAQAALAALEATNSEGDSLLRGRRSLAIYDGDEPRILGTTNALLARYPQDGNLHLSRIASLYEVEGQIAGDAALAQRASEPWPDPLLLARWSGRMAADGRRQEEAMALVRRALRRDGCCGRAWSELSDRLWSLQGVQEGLLPARWASTLMPTEEWAASAYARACKLAGKADEGLAWLIEREQIWGDRSGGPALTLADELDSLQREPEANAMLEAALLRRPADMPLRLGLAERWLRQQRLDEAQQLLDGAVEAHVPALLRQQALLLESRAEIESAMEIARQAVALEPLNLLHHRLLLRLLRRQLGTVGALAQWRDLADAHPAHFGLQRLLYDSLADQPDAINAQLERMHVLHPTNAWLQRERAVQASRQGRIQEGLQLAKAACLLSMDAAVSHDIVAYCALRAEGYEAALPHLHAALQRDAEYEPAMLRLLQQAPTAARLGEACDFVAEELSRQVLLGDGLLSFQAEAKVWPAEQLLAWLQARAAQWPNLWQGPISVARQLRSLLRLDEAMLVLNEAAAQFPALPRVHLELGEALRQAGQAQAALQANARTLALSPAWNPSVRLQVDLLGDHGRQWTQAEAVLRHALQQRDGFDDADLMGLMAWVLEKQGRDEDALTELRRSLILDPRQEWVWAIGRRVCERAEDLSRFDSLIDAVLQSRPGDVDAWLVRASQGRDDAAALEAAEKAVRLEPRSEAAWQARFERLQRLDRTAEIDELLKSIPWPAPGPMGLRVWSARLLWEKRERQSAIAALQAMRADAPQDEALCLRLADWQDDIDDKSGYVATARELLQLSPLAARSHGYMGHALLKAGRAAEAIEPLQHALKLAPSYSFAAVQLAKAAQDSDQPALAEPALQALWPHRSTVDTAALGIKLAAAAGKREEARAWLDRLFELDDYDIDQCREAFQAWRKVGLDWAIELQQRQRVQVEKGGGPIGVCMDWLLERERRSYWLALLEAVAWQRRGAQGPHLLRALLRWLGDNEARFALRWVIKRFEAPLRSDSTGWGEVSYAFGRLNEHRRVIEWMHDWRSQERPPSYALTNLVGALGVVGNWAEQRELLSASLPRFPYLEDLRLWQLLHLAQDGDSESLCAALALCHEWAPDAWMKSLINAMQCFPTLLQASPGKPSASLRMALQQLPADLPRVGQAFARELKRLAVRRTHWTQRWLWVVPIRVHPAS